MHDNVNNTTMVGAFKDSLSDDSGSCKTRQCVAERRRDAGSVNNRPPCGRSCGRTSDKWVFCNNKWKKVDIQKCKAVYEDPELKACKKYAKQAYFKGFPGTPISLWGAVDEGGKEKSFYCSKLLLTCSPNNGICDVCKPTKGGSCESENVTKAPPAPPRSCNCAKGNRIVGGTEARRYEFPWQVGIYKNHTFDRPACGGSIISRRSILTAAHCLEWATVSQILELQVVVGAIDTKKVSERQRKSVCGHAMHPEYEDSDFDFALLQLCEDLTFSMSINAVCLPSPNRKFEGVTATVTGWGSIYSNGPRSNVLQKVDVRTMSNVECTSNPYRYRRYRDITDNMICAAEQGKDSCQGDSGGPIVEKSTKTLIGVVSWGIGCAHKRYPGVYARVTRAIDWINKNMEGKCY